MMRRRSIGKPALLAGCALGAWLAIAPSAAMAQAFQGTPTTVTGSDPVINVAPAYTQIQVRSAETVINWEPFDGAGAGTIDFLPAGATAEFTEPSGTFDYTVLNRILPADVNGIPVSRPVAFNGTVIGLTGNNPGGNIWFYSPTGMIAGPTAVFNVGSLILTTNDISFVPNDPAAETIGSIYGPGGLVEFRGPADSTGFVEVQPGAQLNAIGPNAYLALVAPRVVQGGTVTVDGQIAYIAAEQVDMTINAGLFDFTLLVGTTDADGIVHTGTTTGPASTDFFADPQRIAMVAMPKNDALTMLLSGSIGYAPAASAFNDGSSIVLSAGFDTPDPFSFSGVDDSSIEIGNATFLNPLTAWATSGIYVLPNGGTSTFSGNASLQAGEIVEVEATTGEFVIADGDLFLGAGRPGTGGAVDLLAQTTGNLPGGVIDIAGTLSAYTSSDGILPAVAPPLDGQGGTITMDAQGGTIEATYLIAQSDGFGNFGADQGGMGTGGTIDILVRETGTIRAQSVDLFASGYGGESDDTGGDGFGGDITLQDTGGTLDFVSVFLGAHGSGGDSQLLAGNGTSGTAAVSIAGQAQVWDYLSVVANSFPGGPATESFGLTGSATGQTGAASLLITGDGSLTLTSGLALTANAQMGVDGQPGFTGQGGGVDLSVTAGGELTVTGSIYAEASALFGGEGIFFDPDSTPTLQGGQVSVTADGGNITAFGLEVRADAYGLHGAAAAGNSTGGTVTVSALGGGRILLDDDSGTSLLTLSANGLGTPGPNPSHAFGGTAQLIAEDGSVTVLGDIEVSASGQIGEFFETPPDGPGHNATGGTATVELRAGTLGTATIDADDLTINATGDGRLILAIGTLVPGGDPIRGDGGDGTGGTAGLTVAAGTLTVSDLTLDSSGIGGGSAVRSGATAWVSGNGFGGTSQFAVDGGVANIVTLDILSNGIGGDGTAGPSADGSELAAVAGEGTGGLASLGLSASGMLRVTDAALEANGLGAPGMDHIGEGDATDGGIGTGGSAVLSSAAGWSGSFQTATLALRGNGVGGAGGLSDGASATPPTGVNGDGGAGFGGAATIDLADGQFSLGPVTLEANGTGGYSGDASSGIPGAFGGYGTGGTARFALIDSSAGPAGPRDIASVAIEASGYGGFGSSFTEQSAAGQADLAVSVLDATAALTLPGSLSVYASGPDQIAGAGIEVSIFGAPLIVGNDIVLSSDAPVTVTAAERLEAGTFATLYGFTVTTTGLIQSGDQMFVEGIFGINAGGLTSGDTTLLDATRGPGPIVVGDLLSAGLVTANGESIEINSSGGLNFAEANATGGNLFIGTVDNLDVAVLSAAGSATLATSAGNITTNDLTAGTFIYVDSFGSAALGNLVAETDAAVTTRGGNLTVGNVTAGDDTWLSVFGTDPSRVLTAGNLVTTGLGADDAPGPTTLFGAYPNGAGPAGNVARLRSSGSLVVGDMQSPGRAILVADAGTTTAGGLSADEALIVLGLGDIALDAIATEGRFYVADSAMFLPNLPDAYDPASLDGLAPVRTGGGLTIGSAVQAGDITVAVAGTATAPSWTSAGGLFIDSGGLFTSGVTVSAGGNASITADNGIDLTALNSGGTTLLRSTLGTIDINNLLSAGAVTAFGRSVDIASSASLAFDDVAALLGNTRIVTAGALTVGGIAANDAIELESGGTFTLSGTARGVSIDVTSTDVVLGAGAALGVRGTTRDLTLRNGDTESDTFIGGEAQAGDFSLDRNEAARMFADESITILAQGDITIDDLAMSFGAGGTNIGAGGLLEISTPGEVNIIGDVALTTSGPDDTFRIDPRLIVLNTDTGSIAMTLFAGEGGGGGTPQGRLELIGDRIVAATGANIAQLESLSDLDAISALLGQPGGTGEPLSAGTIRLDVVESLYIQNSGASDAFADRRGFAASGLEIVTESNATQIAINGRILIPGGAATGLETAPLVSINGAAAAAGGRFDPRSTINGCVIGADCNPPPEPELPHLDLPTSEDVEGPVPSQSERSLFVAQLIELAGTEPLITPPLVDEPITGVGNDDLWEPRCEPGEEGSPCPEDDGQP